MISVMWIQTLMSAWCRIAVDYLATYVVHFCFITYTAYVCVIDLLVMLLLYQGTTPLHRAAKSGHLQIAQNLYFKGADINSISDVSTYINEYMM